MKIATGWQCPEHSSNSPMSCWLWCPLQGCAGVGTQRHRNPHTAHAAMAELVGEQSRARVTSPGPSPPSLWGHPGLNEGIVREAFPCPWGCNTVPVSKALRAVHGAAPDFSHSPSALRASPGQGAEPGVLCGHCQGHSCCWHCSGLPGGRSNTAPGQLPLPTGCSVVVIPHHRNNKDDFFFPVGVSWPPLEADSVQPVLVSCSLLRGEGHGGTGVSYKTRIGKGQFNLEKPIT